MLNNSLFSQTQGCLVNKTLYTHYYGYTSATVLYYDNDILVASDCGWTRSASGQFTCYVYKGSGSMSSTSSYNGPYQGGYFTTISNCPIDNQLLGLVFVTAIFGVYSVKKKQLNFS